MYSGTASLIQDIYYRKAKEECYRARSAYKLLQIDDIYHIFDGTQRVVDLCGAPGSWSQVCRKKLGEMGLFAGKKEEGMEDHGERIVSVDLQQTAPIDNVFHVVGDITKGETLQKILAAFKGQLCDLVICDGAPDITGFHDMDQYIQSQLLVAALNITVKVLKKGGNFVAKIFKGSEIGFLYSQFKLYFKEIHIFK